MLSLDIYQEPPSDWNSFLLKTETGSLPHTIEYSKYAKKWLGWEPIFLRICDEKGTILLQNLLFQYYPGIKKIPNQFKTIYKKFKKSLRWKYGPVSISNDATTYFFDYLIKNKKTFHGTTHPLMKFQYQFKSQIKWSTFLIDLHKSKENIFNDFEKHSCQKNITRSLERGVKVEEISKNNFQDYFNLIKNSKDPETSKKYNLGGFLDFWEFLQPIGFKGFLAKKDNTLLGALSFSHFNNHIVEYGVARSKSDVKEKLYSQDLIKWEIIKWGIKHNMKWMDLAGFNPNPQTAKEQGILRYKKKWGGKQFDYWILQSD